MTPTDDEIRFHAYGDGNGRSAEIREKAMVKARLIISEEQWLECIAQSIREVELQNHANQTT